MATNLQTLEDELNTCDGEISELSQFSPDSVLAQLRQGLRASKQELKTLEDYLKRLERYREVSSRLRGSSAFSNTVSVSPPV